MKPVRCVDELHPDAGPNIQAYSIVVVRDAAVRGQLAELAGGQAHVAATPVFLAVCGDLSRAERACALHGKQFRGDTLEMGLVAAVDASLVGMSIMVAAESLGLGCVMIGGLRNRPLDVARILGLPPRAFAVFGMLVTEAILNSTPARQGRLYLSYPVLLSDYEPTAVEEFLKLGAAAKLPSKHLTAQVMALASVHLFVEALKRAGRDVTRDKLIDVLEHFYEVHTGFTPPVSVGPNRRIGLPEARVVTVEQSTGQLCAAH